MCIEQAKNGIARGGVIQGLVRKGPKSAVLFRTAFAAAVCVLERIAVFAEGSFSVNISWRMILIESSWLKAVWGAIEAPWRREAQRWPASRVMPEVRQPRESRVVNDSSCRTTIFAIYPQVFSREN